MTTTISKSKAFLVEQPMSRQLGTVAIGAMGGLAFWWLGIPAGAMSGALASVATVGSLSPSSIAPLGRKLRLIAMLVSLPSRPKPCAMWRATRSASPP